MPRYFFHVQNGLRLVDDTEGSEFDSDGEARQHATTMADEMKGRFKHANGLIMKLHIDIVTDAGKLVGWVPIRGELPPKNKV